MRRLLLVILVASMVAVPVRPAAACTCPTFDTRRMLSEYPAAFVGTIVSRQEHPAPAGDPDAPPGATYTFRVDRAVKGDLGEQVDVISPADQSACGIAAPADTPVGLILDRRDGQWVGSLCRQPSPERLLRAAAPLPPPGGELPPALLIGSTYGTSRSVALDAEGRVAALGEGAGVTSAVAPCPGRERVVELFGVRDDAGAVTPGVGVRRMATMATEAEHRLTGLRAEPGSSPSVDAVACRDAEGRDLLVFARDGLEAAERGRILRLQDGQISTVWEGPAPKTASFGPAGRAAYLNLRPNGEDLVVVDLADPDATPTPVQAVARLPFDSGPMVASPDGRRLATVAPAANRPSRAVLVHLGGDDVTVATADLGSAGITGEMVWVDDERVVFSPRLRPAERVRLYDASLTEVTSWMGWTAEHSVAVGGFLYGVSQGAVRVAPLETGPATLIRELEDALMVGILDVSVDDDRDPDPDGSGPVAGSAGATTTTTTPPTTTTEPPAPGPPGTATTSTAPPPGAGEGGPSTSTPPTTRPETPAERPDPPDDDETAGRPTRPAGGGDGGSAAPAFAALAGVAAAAGAGSAAVWRRRRRQTGE